MALGLYCPGTNTTYSTAAGSQFVESEACDASQATFSCTYSCCPGPNTFTCFTCGCTNAPPGLSDFYNAVCSDLALINNQAAFCSRLEADIASLLSGTCRTTYERILASFNCSNTALGPTAASTATQPTVPSPANTTSPGVLTGGKLELSMGRSVKIWGRMHTVAEPSSLNHGNIALGPTATTYDTTDTNVVSPTQRPV